MSQVPNSPGQPHPRNQHLERYDFARLTSDNAELAAFVLPHPCGGDTIDFSNPAAVKALNRALLRTYYGFANWDIPPGYLCPPIPSRADYIHHLADLLGEDYDGRVPSGPNVRVLDIGTGANCVYPIIGAAEYGWRFVGSEIDPIAFEWASRLIAQAEKLAGLVELRRQTDPQRIFRGVLHGGENFDATLCNPPFHASAMEAAAGTLRKLRNLGGGSAPQVALNFGGQSNELWCDGGEAGFVRRMISESSLCRHQVGWFTTLISKRASLPAIYRQLEKVAAVDVRTIPMAQGQKKSRIVAWSFMTSDVRQRRKGTGAT